MVVLIGIAGSLALLYFWLSGHWFGRVVAFLTFIVPSIWILSGLLWSSMAPYFPVDRPGFAPSFVALMILPGAVIAWLIASMPIGYRNWRARQMLVASRRVMAQPDAASCEAPPKVAPKRLVGAGRIRIDPVF